MLCHILSGIRNCLLNPLLCWKWERLLGLNPEAWVCCQSLFPWVVAGALPLPLAVLKYVFSELRPSCISKYH